VQADFFVANLHGFPWSVVGAIVDSLGFKHHEPLFVGKASTVLMCRQFVIPNSECLTVSLAGQDQPMTQEYWWIPKFMMRLREENCALGQLWFSYQRTRPCKRTRVTQEHTLQFSSLKRGSLVLCRLATSKINLFWEVEATKLS